MKKPRDVWETTDGKLHRDKAAAKRHEAWLELVAFCDAVTTCGTEPLCGDVLAVSIRADADSLARILRAKPERAGHD
jgi:hypothetical protein